MRTDEEILKRWKEVVDFSSNIFEKTPEELKLFVSQKLEEWEEKCLQWEKDGKIDRYFTKIFIPLVRQSLGNIIMEEDVLIGENLGIVVLNGRCREYSGKIGIVYKEGREITGPIPFVGLYTWENDRWIYR